MTISLPPLIAVNFMCTAYLCACGAAVMRCTGCVPLRVQVDVTARLTAPAGASTPPLPMLASRVATAPSFGRKWAFFSTHTSTPLRSFSVFVP